MKEALRVLSDKAVAVRDALDVALAGDDGGAMSAANISRATVAAMRTGADELA